MTIDLLERALVAEERAEKAEGRVADLEGRLRGAISADPTTAIRALSWISRAEQAEKLVEEIVGFVRQRSLAATELPDGWFARAEAQLQALAILRRDHAEMMERPVDDDYWTRFEDSLGKAGVVRDDAGWLRRRQ